MLDINSGDLGLLLPRVTSIEDVTDGRGNLAVDITVVYDVSRDKPVFESMAVGFGYGEKDSGGNSLVEKVNPFWDR